MGSTRLRPSSFLGAEAAFPAQGTGTPPCRLRRPVRQPPAISHERQGVRTGPIITTLVCGTALVIMPQIHAAVFSANLLAYAGVIAAGDRPPVEGLAEVAAPGWMAPASTALGVGMIIAGALAGLGARRGTPGRTPVD